MIDAHAFQEKLGLTTCAPDTELPAVHKRVPSAVGYSTVKLDDTMTLKSFQSTKLFEGYLVVKSGEKQTAVFSDVVMNVPSGRLMFKLLGLSGGAKVPFLQRFLFITNTELLKQELNAVADAPGFGRVIVTHGDVIDSDAPAALKRIIATA
jgi:hypothetical protein